MNRMEQWLTLIAAETEDDLKELEEITDVPEILQVINELREMSKDEAIVKECEERERQLKEYSDSINAQNQE